MPHVTSADGTSIAYSIQGQGPVLILIEGALSYRTAGAWDGVADLLKDRFTCITYDRRGKGETRDDRPYAKEREIEDIAALLGVNGRPATLAGLSSGAALALEAADRLENVERVITYEVPFVVDDAYPPLPAGFRASIEKACREGRASDGLKIFMRRVGVPGFMLWIMPLMPMWKRLKTVAHTLGYDLQFVETFSAGTPLPANAWPNIAMPALCMAGGKSPAYMINAQRAIAENLANASYRELPGQTHMVKPEPLSEAIVEFLA